LKSNAEHGGMVWSKYLSEGHLEYADIRSAMTSHHRHANTDYDYLLRSGASKEAARDAVKTDDF
tara:strand:+ start:1983 stop:2174 length:192 start_codon:yes stop_codon:yes gene_type:complete